MGGIHDLLADPLVNRFEVGRAAVGPDVTFEDLEMESIEGRRAAGVPS